MDQEEDEDCLADDETSEEEPAATTTPYVETKWIIVQPDEASQESGEREAELQRQSIIYAAARDPAFMQMLLADTSRPDSKELARLANVLSIEKQACRPSRVCNFPSCRRCDNETAAADADATLTCLREELYCTGGGNKTCGPADPCLSCEYCIPHMQASTSATHAAGLE